MKQIFLLLTVIAVISCAGRVDNNLGPHETRFLTIDPSKEKMMDASEYDIVDVVPLDLPEKYPAVVVADIQIANDRIYILDQLANKTVLMFDTNGKFISQLGRVGHARNEYVKAPESFSVDEKTGIAYLYDRDSDKMLKFDSEGNFLESIEFKNCVPGSFAVTGNANFLCCSERGMNYEDAQLALYDKDGRLIESFLAAPSVQKLSLMGKPIYKDGDRISCYPFLSDSIVVFKGDELDYTIKIDFQGQFTPEEIRKKSMEEGDFMPLYEHKGAQFINQIEVTDSLIHVGYAYNLTYSHFVKNMSNGKTYNTTHGPLFYGYVPMSEFYVAKDKLLYYIDEEHVNAFNPNKPGVRNSSKPTMLDIMDKKYKFPLIMMVKLK